MQRLLPETQRLLDFLGHSEEPMGIVYTDTKPEDGYGPAKGEILSREKESRGDLDFQTIFNNFSCIIGNIWLARKKKKPAWLSLEHSGCMGGGFYAGMYSPYLELNIAYVSTGIPGTPMEGEHYLPSHESMRAFMDAANPRPAPATYAVIKPLSLFADGEEPEIVVFFARGEVLTGLGGLSVYATGDYNVNAAPFGAGCTNIITWPLTYLARGEERAVIGGMDPSCRKFVKTDELTFAVPLMLYRKMLAAMDTSFLARDTWEGVRKKVLRSRKAWGEE